MKMLTQIALILIPTITLSTVALAHDPAMHNMTNEKADCKNMDHSKMDMKDPVAMAMMKKCMQQSEHTEMKVDQSKMDHSQKPTMQNQETTGEGQSSHKH